MKIIQLLPVLNYGDAVGNDAIALKQLISKMGFETEIYVEDMSPQRRINAKHYWQMPKLEENDVLIYHFSIGSAVMSKLLNRVKCKKVMIYHNITPAKFFEPYGATDIAKIAKIVKAGREDLVSMKYLFDYSLADSSFNKAELEELGYSCPKNVLPILIPFEDYAKKPNQAVLEKYNDDWTNILFVGRVVPNKKQEDVIRAFAYYKKNVNPKSRLFLVGSYDGMEEYYDRLCRYVDTLAVNDVNFTGHIGFSDILAYYRLADVFLCMSEHEGFCVPIAEAMNFHVPIIAYASCAVPETMGEAGIVVDKKDVEEIAGLIEKIRNNEGFRNAIIEKEKERLQYFSYESISVQAERFIRDIVNEDKEDFIKQDNLRLQFTNDLKQKNRIQTERDNVYPIGDFDNIPVIKRPQVSQSAPLSLKMRHFVKICLFRPIYHIAKKVAPELSYSIKRKIYHTILAHASSGYVVDIIGIAERKKKSYLYVDVTPVIDDNVNHAVVSAIENISRDLVKLNRELQFVQIFNSNFITADSYADKLIGKVPGINEYNINIGKDNLLLPNEYCDRYVEYACVADELHLHGGRVTAIIANMAILIDPTLAPSSEVLNVFKKWHDMLLEKSDIVICASKKVADDVIAYYQNVVISRKDPLKIFAMYKWPQDGETSMEGPTQEILDIMNEKIEPYKILQ